MYEPMAEIISDLLWRHQAIVVRSQEPFQLSSGNSTPLYINCRLLHSYPATRDLLTSFFQAICYEENIEADCIAGGETAGIAFGALLAQRLNKPFVYIRKKTKGHGTGSLIEGIPQGRVTLVEDLITDGGSKLGFIRAIHDAGCNIEHCLVVVDREQGGNEVLAKLGVKLHALVRLSTCLDMGVRLKILSPDALQQVLHYLADPKGWHKKKGLPYADVSL
ncbi:MAG: orotate phosphoribosyltransferase [Acidobacteria bacterium]|nr:orotate phosphoribosyltransferase [Acidobacteriota bacterium]